MRVWVRFIVMARGLDDSRSSSRSRPRWGWVSMLYQMDMLSQGDVREAHG